MTFAIDFRKVVFFLLGLAALCFALPAAQAQAVRDKYVEAELVPLYESIQPGKPFYVALRLKHDKNWHTYWKSSSTGYAPSISWKLPEGFTAGDIEWPAPRPYQIDFIVDFIYENEALLPVKITPPATLQTDATITLSALAEWLMCEKVCIPGSASLSLSLPVSSDIPQLHPKWGKPLQATLANLPITLPDVEAKASLDGDTFTLSVKSRERPLSSLGEVYFFSDNGLIEPTPSQTPTANSDGSFSLSFKRAVDGPADATALTGILKAANGWQADGGLPAIEIKAAFAAKVEPVAAATVVPPPSIEAPVRPLAIVLLFAFIGGAILNLMPCVFPVLGIKVMSFVKQAGEERSKIVLHGLTFTAGVLLSFWVLSAAFLIIKAAGNTAGWGFQLQHPEFVFLVTIFILLFALNMSGLFEIGQSAVGVGSDLQTKSGYTGSFFSGVLATIVATPCSAPFLGTALAAAVARPAFEMALTFTFVGIGLASPYLLFSIFPQLVQKLPRPGAWMETFKQSMAFLLYATVAYLVWTLTGQMTEEFYGSHGLLKTLLALVIVALAAWVYGRYTAFHLEKSTKLKGFITTFVLLAIALFVGYPKIDQEAVDAALKRGSGTATSGVNPAVVEGSDTVNWEKWAPGLPESLAADGHTVYVDFTARWCATCQTNKAIVFGSQEVLQVFRKDKIIALKADWTSPDPRITAELQKYNRAAIPFNMVYKPNLAEPILLPEVLTPSIVLGALK